MVLLQSASISGLALCGARTSGGATPTAVATSRATWQRPGPLVWAANGQGARGLKARSGSGRRGIAECAHSAPPPFRQMLSGGRGLLGRASTVYLAPCRMLSIIFSTPRVASPERCARPRSPYAAAPKHPELVAQADSIAALKTSRLVCTAKERMTSITRQVLRVCSASSRAITGAPAVLGWVLDEDLSNAYLMPVSARATLGAR